jgi:hypothetical protein
MRRRQIFCSVTSGTTSGLAAVSPPNGGVLGGDGAVGHTARAGVGVTYATAGLASVGRVRLRRGSHACARRASHRRHLLHHSRTHERGRGPRGRAVAASARLWQMRGAGEVARSDPRSEPSSSEEEAEAVEAVEARSRVGGVSGRR